MTQLPKLYLITLLSLCLPAIGAVAKECGGDGPTPIIHENVTPKYQQMSTMGSILEYSVSDATNEVFYRTDGKEIYKSAIGSTKSNKVTDSPYVLSRVMHKKGNYLVTEGDAYIWNLATSKAWEAMTLSTTVPVTPLYWESDLLYSVREEDDNFGTPSWHVQKYKAGDAYSNRVCGFIPAKGYGYELAGGHHFPYVYFYKTSSAVGGTLLTLYRFDTRTCFMNTLATYTKPISGNIKWVHWFTGSNTIAVATDHPTKNLLYDQGKGICSYFDLGGDEPVITNPRMPVVAVVRSDNSADLIHLQTGKKNDLSTTSNYYSNTRLQDFYLTNDGKNLFVAPESGGTRELVQIRIKP
jgi:hypothetical protein